jgi:hypothetical protein
MAGPTIRTRSRPIRLRSKIVLLPVAALLAAAAFALSPWQPALGETQSPGTPLIGEHSALAAREVDARNAALGSMPPASGEHAGMTKSDYEAGSALDRLSP